MLGSLLFSFLIGTALVSARSWKPSDLPSPQKDPDNICRRQGKPSAICDPDGVLSPRTADELDGLANFIAEGSHGFALADCAGTLRGYQVALAVLQTMQNDGRNLDRRAEVFAKELHDSWGVGDAECNNGVVLLVSLQDRRMYISAGKGTTKLLSDKAIQAVLSDMKSYLRAGQVEAALKAGVVDIGEFLAGGRKASQRASSFSWLDMIPLGLFGFFISFVCFTAGRNYRHRLNQYRNCRRALEKLETDRSLARRNVYETDTCPICLENFEKPNLHSSPSSSVNDDKSAESACELRARIRGSQQKPFRRKSSSSSSPRAGPTDLRAGEASSSIGPSSTASSVHIDDHVDTQSVGADSGGPQDIPLRVVRAGGSGMERRDESDHSTQALRCGHKFHTACLRSMLQAAHDKCPVCRQPVVGNDDELHDGGDGSRGNDMPSSAQRRNLGRPGDWNSFYPEYLFRLQRARYLYPNFITLDMLHRWGDRNNTDSLVTDASFRGLDPTRIQQARQSGSYGSTFSFGGGGSSGGGGGGSSW